MSRLFDALEKRFDDVDELKDIYNHGMASGFGGFIYYNEIRTFFFEHEDEIEDYLYDTYGDELTESIARRHTTVNEIINYKVWAAVETWVGTRLSELEEVEDSYLSLA